MKTRIWVYWNRAITKITVSSEKPVTLYKYERTDEGYHAETETYQIEDGKIFRHITTNASDCDGPLDTYRSCVWEIGGPMVPMVAWDLQGNMRELPEMRPDWETVNSYQRDHFAEAAGY